MKFEAPPREFIAIAVTAVIGVLILQLSGAIPLASVGGAMVIAMAFLVAALAVGIHEAWTKKRGVLGWIVNIIVSLVGAYFAAQAGGMIMVMVLMPFMAGSSSIAAAGGAVMSFALAGTMLFTMLGSWFALMLANRWR